MKQLKKQKLKIILGLLGFACLLLVIRLIFFLPDGANKHIEKILYSIIFFISLLIVIFALIPTKESLKYIIRKYRDIILLNLFIFILELSFIIKNQLNYSTITIFSILFAFTIFNIILLIIPKKIKYVMMIITFVIYPFYVGSQDVYYSLFNEFFSFKDAVSLNEGMEFTEGINFFKFYQIFLIIFTALTIFIFLMIKVDNRIKLRHHIKNLIALPLLLFILMHLNAVYPYKSERVYLSDDYLYYSDYSNKKFVGRFGTLNYLVRDLYDTIVPKHVSQQDYDEIDQYFAKHQKNHETNDYTGIFKDKNLVFIQAESLDYIAINETLTPNISKLMNEGINFSNNYIPVYPRTTSDTEIIYNTSIIPSIVDGPTCYTYNQNSYRTSLANLFNQSDYQTNAFHSNKNEFYMRSEVYVGLGYDHFYGQEDLGLSDTEKRYDSVFFEKAQDKVLKSNRKFFSYIISLSGHNPYNSQNLAVDKHIDEVNRYYGNTVPQEIKNYIAAQMEIDRLVGEVLDSLQEKGLLDNTVIVLAADHYPYTIDSTIYEKYKGVESEYLKSKSPFVIWTNDLPHQEITKVTSSYDVLPTLANMFDLNANYTYYFGNDVFSNNYQPLVFYKDYSWFDGTNYAIDGQLISGDASFNYVDQTTQMVNEYFTISKEILRTNYFKTDDDM